MVGIIASEDSRRVTIFGHGVTVSERFEIDSGIWIEAASPQLDLDTTVKGCPTFSDYAAVIHGAEIASFAIQVETHEGGKALAAKAWNALWLFHLIGIACHSPCNMLYSMSDGAETKYSATGRNPFLRPVGNVHTAATDELLWVRQHLGSFDGLISVPEFNSAVRCLGNVAYLHDADVKIMLLWAGIEGLLNVEAELSRRLALYAALMKEGTPAEKGEYFKMVKDAYSIRSRAVHGGNAKPDRIELGLRMATEILTDPLKSCIKIGRVPKPTELDLQAVGANVR